MKPEIGQRWRFVGKDNTTNYIAELLHAENYSFRFKILQVITSSDSQSDMTVGSFHTSELLTTEGPKVGAYGETWHYLSGQEKPL